MAKDEAWKAHVEEYDRDRFDSTSRHRRHCFDAGWDAALGNTLTLLEAIAKRYDLPVTIESLVRLYVSDGELRYQDEFSRRNVDRAEVEALLKGEPE